ncbi:MAG: ribose 5-phosphate isomerase B [Candidatus Brocadiae bacterium]|nr:ribose 5-phosphate isomerase B [Candidatus Brocadiia bacterium]
MKIALGSDHAGFQAKEALKLALATAGHVVEDLGTKSTESVDYSDFGLRVARAVSEGAADRGIAICGTGIGMCIAANKVRGIRAAVAHDAFTAEMSRRHNDANVLCLGARLLAEDRIRELSRLWLETPFEGGRHERRIGRISDYEKG